MNYVVFHDATEMEIRYGFVFHALTINRYMRSHDTP